MLKEVGNAIDIAEKYGSIDGAHHKQWVIDQMLQKLMGPENYKKWLEEANSDPKYDDWDQGIAP